MSGAGMEYERFNKGNRLVRGIFLRRRCGHFDHADILGATNIVFAAQVAAREVSVAASAA